ncbi:unnamed protein product [Polarella glacialis]|uniref:Prolyl 4-hydroxylase alpha subunit domain-containing protein n=3 Tax=Polarella glacialis TaxID=89957 RepID=A0A813H6U5_POLGL|nr:unnamed protein product [Polarella glacialis]
MSKEDELEIDYKEVNKQVLASLDRYAGEMIEGLRERGWWASETAVLPAKLRRSMRDEVEALWNKGEFQQSQSVRGGTEYYDKKHVFATEITGAKYETAPRLAHYTVAMSRELARRVSAAFPDMRLDENYIGNKLNMSVGSGAAFDAHLDVGVGEKPFNRKLSLLFYLNNSWRPALGGEIVLLGEGATEEEAASHPGTVATGLPLTLSPISGRWIAFWSDTMLHKVLASEAPAGLEDYRVSYVIWLCTKDDDQSGDSPPTAAISKPPGSFEAAPAFASF